MTETMDPATLRAELARRRLLGATTARPAAGPTRADRGADLPLSHAQHRLWVLDQVRPGSTEYLTSVALRLRGDLDAGALRAALDAVVARHEVLRTRYTLSAAGDPVQVIDEPGPVELTVLDLRALAPADREARIAALGTHDRQPVDLAEGPPLRATLARLADGEHALVLTVHHIAMDGWSEGLLVGELARHYAANTVAGPLPLQYADVAAWQRTEMSGNVLDGHLGYWRTRLAGLSPLELPADRSRPPVRDSAGALHTFAIPAETAAALTRLARDRGATVFQALLAVFDILLSRYTGQHDIAVGTPIVGRDRPEVQDLIGLFVNTVVLRADLSGLGRRSARCCAGSATPCSTRTHTRTCRSSCSSTSSRPAGTCRAPRCSPPCS
nr:hypothetical protein GCM10020092_035200 [Actinoplanes digitatis]